MIVAIPDGDSGLTVPVLRALGLVPEVRVVVLSRNRWASARYSRLTLSTLNLSTLTHSHPGALDPLESAGRHLADSRADVVLPLGLGAIEFFSCHGLRRLGNVPVAPVPPWDAFRITSCKRAFAGWARETGMPIPPTLLGEEARVPGSVEERLGFPVLVKPRAGSGGSDIRSCRNREELAVVFESLRPPQEWIVQRHVPGHDWTCNVLCREGTILGATVSRHLFASNHPYGPGEGVEFVEEPEVLEIARKVMGALRWSGVANLDLRHDQSTGRFVLLEINPRFWRNTALSALAGVNFPHLACLEALGANLPPPSQRPVRVAKFREAVSRRLRGFVSGKPPGYDLSEVPLVLSDPLPLMAVAAGWMARRIGVRPAAPGSDAFACRR